jgi:general secretion pathway protein A
MFYESWFNLSEPPFSISPDPRYLYLTKGHQEALAHLLYGVSGNGGFVLLTGEVGAGKTTVCRCLLEQLPDDVDVALVLSPKLGAEEFLQAICDELDISLYGDKEITLKHLVDNIYKYLLEAYGRGRNTVLIVDEAQNLSPDVLEHLRLLTNLETNERKLLQIMLIGQPELRELIASPALRQMAQRITARFHLDVLSFSDAEGYIKHRLAVAGCAEPLFDKSSIKYIWKRSGGVPRLINSICDRALLGARVGSEKQVSIDIARKAAMEVMGDQGPQKTSHTSFSIKVVVIASFAFLLALAAIIVYDRFGVNFWSAGAPLTPLSPNRVQTTFVEQAPETTKLAPSVGEYASHNDSGTGRKNQLLIQNGALAKNEVNLPKEEQGQRIVAIKERIANLPKENWPGSSYQAQQRLMEYWGFSYDAEQGPSVCEFAKIKGLLCLQGQGGLQDLISLNRPAILTLYNQYLSKYQVTLLMLKENIATINLLGKDIPVDIDELARLWDGEYMMFWKPPVGYRSTVRKGATGQVVEWLADKLAITRDGVTVNTYDEIMVKRVALFQKLNGLVPDGEAGPLTIIGLNNLGPVEGPRLMAASD